MEPFVESIETYKHKHKHFFAYLQGFDKRASNAIFVLFIFLAPQILLAQIDNNFFNGGGIRVGDSTTVCAGNGGGIRFDANSSDGGGLQYCDGTNWLSLLTSSFTGVVNNGNSFAAPMIIGTNDSNTLAFETNGITRMTIDTSGNIGIGGATSSYTLDVGGDLNVDFGIRVGGNILLQRTDTDVYSSSGATASLSSTASAQLYNTSATDGAFSSLELKAINGNANYQEAYIAATSTAGAGSHTPSIVIGQQIGASAYQERLRIDASGNVGIGTTTPNVALDINGSIEYTGTITDVSDRRLKENILPIDNALEIITEVRGVSFIMKGDEKRRIEFGVIAQDTEAVLPELVHTADDEMKSKSVNYIGFIGWIIEAIKELNYEKDQEVSSIRDELKEKDKKILDLENKIKELRGLIEEKLN